MRLSALFALLVLVLVACKGTDSGGTTNASSSSGTTPGASDRLPDLNIPAPSANGFQIVLPIVPDIEPGSSHEICSWTDKTFDADVDVKAGESFQTKTGHHAIVFYTMNAQPPGTTRECVDDDMATFRFVIAAGLGEGSGGKNVLPGDLAVHVPKGAQIVVQHHYLNAGATTVEAQTAVNVEFVEPGAKITRSSAVTWLDTSIRVPPGVSGVDIKCTLNNDLNLWYMFPHMHKWGQHIRVIHQPMGDTAPETLFDLDWDPDFTFHPPEVKKDPAQPLAYKKGDQFNIHCDWNNTSGKDLPFGLEMCVVFGQMVDTASLGNVDCNLGQWGSF